MRICYQSLGRDIAGFTRRDVARSLALCEVGHVAFRSFCFVGVVKNLIDVDWRTDEAFAFCRGVPAASKAACYRAIGEQVAGLFPAEDRRRTECARAEPAYVGPCRAGAQIA